MTKNYSLYCDTCYADFYETTEHGVDKYVFDNKATAKNKAYIKGWSFKGDKAKCPKCIANAAERKQPECKS